MEIFAVAFIIASSIVAARLGRFPELLRAKSIALLREHFDDADLVQGRHFSSIYQEEKRKREEERRRVAEETKQREAEDRRARNLARRGVVEFATKLRPQAAELAADGLLISTTPSEIQLRTHAQADSAAIVCGVEIRVDRSSSNWFIEHYPWVYRSGERIFEKKVDPDAAMRFFFEQASLNVEKGREHLNAHRLRQRDANDVKIREKIRVVAIFFAIAVAFILFDWPCLHTDTSRGVVRGAAAECVKN